MKRHINKKWTLMLALVLVLSSCEDFLERNPLDSVSGENFWKSKDEAYTALAGVYSRLQSNFLGYERIYLDGLSDNAYVLSNGNQSNLANMTTGNISPSLGGAISNMYSTPYRTIASCNYFLDNVDRAPLTENEANAMKGEVRFIRALSYFDLVQAFGGVVIYDHFPELLNDAKIAKSTVEQVYQFIEDDLTFAITNLPDERFDGHAVKGSAQALLGRVLITQNKWNEAIAPLEDVINSGLYALAKDYAGLFKTAGQAQDSVSKEIIFATQYLAPSNVHRLSPGSAGMDIELGLWSLLQPYTDLADDYEMTDGLPASESPFYDAADPYANRDPRLDMTMKLPNEDWIGGDGEEYDDFAASQTGLLMEKYLDLSRAPIKLATAQESDQDYVHLRYADVLLMYAEAKNEVNGPDAIVYDAINQVRGRQGVEMPAVDESRYNTKETLRTYIWHERRIELALEGQRYNDLKRWKIAHTKLPTLQTPDGTPLVFNQTNYVLPFAQSELDNNPKLVQNDGYQQ